MGHVRYHFVQTGASREEGLSLRAKPYGTRSGLRMDPTVQILKVTICIGGYPKIGVAKTVRIRFDQRSLQALPCLLERRSKLFRRQIDHLIPARSYCSVSR